MDNCIETECLNNSTCLIDNCNIFGNNLNLKTKNQNLNIHEQEVGNGNHFVNEIQIRTNKCEKSNLEKIDLLRYIIKMPQLQHSYSKQIVKYQESLGMTRKTECQKLNDGVINAHGQSCCSNYVITNHACEKESLPECTNTNIGSCKIQQLLRVIEECCCSQEPSDPTNKLLEQTKSTICSLAEEIEIHSLALKHNQENLKCCTEKLNVEQEMYKNKDSELCRMKIDVSLLADQLTQIIKHYHYLSCNIDEVSKDLLTRIIAYNTLLKKSEELKEELNNVKFCLNIRIDENKCIKRELREKYQVIEAGIIIKQELEFKLSNLENKLEKLENLNNCWNKKCNDLIIQNIKVENDLKNEKNYNSKKAIYIDDLSKQIHDLKTIIKGIEDHKMLYTEEISKLKNQKCTAELKLKELNSIIIIQKNELVITRSELAYAEECLKNKNDCQIQKIQQLEHDSKNFEKEVQFYKVQHDFLTNKCLLSDKDLTETREIIKSLEFKINKMMREHNTILDELSKECDNLKIENCKFLENINELNESIIYANKKENHVRNDLATRNEKLLIANDEIKNCYLEMKCIKTKLENATDKLTCIERELEETKLKLNKETCLKEKINEKYCSIKYECTCPLEKCQTADNNRLSDENIMSYNIAKNVKDGVQTIHLQLVDVGSQTHMCPAICQPIATSTNCKSKFHSISNNSDPCKLEQCDSNTNNLRPCDNCNSCISSCDSDKISINPCQLDHKKTSICISPSDDNSCSGESKNTPKCFGSFFDKENLQCQLNEMKLLLKKKEKAAKEELCDTEQIYYNKEMIINKRLEDTKEQCQKELEKANSQLEIYETAILYKEYELKNSQIREHQYKMAIEQLNETIQIKDKEIESEQKKVASALNSMKYYEDQLLSLQKKLELEQLNKHKSDENLQLLDDKMDSEMDNKLETSQTCIKKKRFSTRRNRNPCALKMSKTVTETKRKKYGPKLNLPCCIGSKNPCNRQKNINLSQRNVN
ncbi:coiled-coil domain-containing protein 18-like [Metopolophium dirhodum]|uniref:coiled-coil domain-containing protein 18-like n=1 Tax=Metopolophium dirhodum TaxID=44670 RepID=UPI00299072F8|nr:coiled-coil domain-containing protein 18-like [Metopolophium dirhodum]